MAKQPIKFAERDWMAKVASLPCVMCHVLGNAKPSDEVHHIRDGQGTSQRAPHRLTIPLCKDCHKGANGVHGNRSYMRIAKVEELDLLAVTLELLQAKYMR